MATTTADKPIVIDDELITPSEGVICSLLPAFIVPKDVDISDVAIKRAKEFSEKVSSTTDYSDSSQNSKNKVTMDHYISKLGEEAVSAACRSFGFTITDPDYTIYDNKNKSWDADLYTGTVGLHVKTQTLDSAQKYGLGWTFSYCPTALKFKLNSVTGRRGRRDKIFEDSEAWLFFVLHLGNNKCRVFPPYQRKQLKFALPRLIHLHAVKRCVYAFTLPNWKEEWGIN